MKLSERLLTWAYRPYQAHPRRNAVLGVVFLLFFLVLLVLSFLRAFGVLSGSPPRWYEWALIAVGLAFVVLHLAAGVWGRRRFPSPS